MSAIKARWYGLRKKGTKRQFLKQFSTRKPYLHLALLDYTTYSADTPKEINELFLASFFYTYDPTLIYETEVNIHIPLQNSYHRLKYEDFEIVGYYSEYKNGKYKYLVDENTRMELMTFNPMKMVIYPNYVTKGKDKFGLDEFKHEIKLEPVDQETSQNGLEIKEADCFFWEELPLAFINQPRDWTLRQTFMCFSREQSTYIFYHDKVYK